VGDDSDDDGDDTQNEEGMGEKEVRDSQNDGSALFFGVLMTLLSLEQIRQLVFIKGGMEKAMMKRHEETMKREMADNQRRVAMFDDLGKTRREEVAIDRHRPSDSNRGVKGEETKRWVEEEEVENQKDNYNRMLKALGRQKRERHLSTVETEGNLEDNARNEELHKIQVEQMAADSTSAISQYIVLESNLVTCGPGLDIHQITPGYDLCQISFQLPLETTGAEIVEMLLEEGLDSSDFHLLWTGENGERLEAIILTHIRFGNALERKVEALSNRGIRIEVRRDAIWTPGAMGHGKEPSVMLTWDSESSSSFCEELSQEVALAAVYDNLFDLEGIRMESCCIRTSDSGSTVELTVEFENWENSFEAVRNMQSKRPSGISSFQAKVLNPHQQLIFIPLLQYEAQRGQWVELFDRDSEEGQVEIEIEIIDDTVTIWIQGENKASVGALKVRVEQLARGEVLRGAYWHPSFASSEASTGFFSNVMKSAIVYLKCHSDTHTLVLYGEFGHIEEARRMIQEEVDRREQAMTKTALTGPSIKFFKNGGIQKLKDLFGELEENVNLKSNSRWSAVMMRGGETATHHLRRLIKESLAKEPVASQEPTPCPVCFEEQLYPEMLECGHGYCSLCLDRFLKASADNQRFPIVCVGDDATCNVPISLSFIQRFLPPHNFKQLVEAAFATYLQQNPTRFRYCKTPDCRQTYRQQTTDHATIVTCPSCFAKNCSSCSEVHENMTCDEYRILRDPEEQDRLNNELADSSGYKRCPRCAVWVEKMGGCNHMNCKCGVHICWICLGIFDPNDIYDHMARDHTTADFEL
jgi:uncharacterized protein YeeX (DUF496 family)